MTSPNYEYLTQYAKSFSGLTTELESVLQQVGPTLIPKLGEITDDFYAHLQLIPEAAPFLEGRLEVLKAAHVKWLENVFTGPYNQAFIEHMYKVGEVHVKVNLPVEFMSGGMTLINNRLVCLIVETYGDDKAFLAKLLKAVSAVTGMSLFVMQQSYQEATLSEELNKFLLITGMSRALFSNLAAAYKTRK